MGGEIPFTFDGKVGHLASVTPQQPPSFYQIYIGDCYRGQLVLYSTGWKYSPQKDFDYDSAFEGYLIDLIVLWLDGAE